MSMSGITVDSEVVTKFNDMKLRSTNKWITFKIENKKKIVLDLENPSRDGEDKDLFEGLKGRLTDEPRYILYDFHFTNKEGRNIKKVAFIFWCSDESKIGDKMIYASSKDTIKKSFTGLGLEFQANDMGDFDYETFRAEVERKA